MFAEFMEAYGMELIAMVLTALLGYIGMVAKRLISRYLDTGDKRALALASVRYVEQVFQQLHGPEKMRKALDKFAVMLDEHGITCSAAEMETLLEAAVNEMNAQSGFPISGIEAPTEETE